MGRRFTPPWHVTETPSGYAVEDANGIRLAFAYGQDVRHSANGHTLTLDEARRIASGIARLPQLLGAAKGAVSR